MRGKFQRLFKLFDKRVDVETRTPTKTVGRVPEEFLHVERRREKEFHFGDVEGSGLEEFPAFARLEIVRRAIPQEDASFHRVLERVEKFDPLREGVTRRQEGRVFLRLPRILPALFTRVRFRQFFFDRFRVFKFPREFVDERARLRRGFRKRL